MIRVWETIRSFRFVLHSPRVYTDPKLSHVARCT
jgi:hypothetical protein